MAYLLDTCALSESTAARPNQRVVDWIDALPNEESFISALTLGEIQKGVASLAGGRKRSVLDRWMQDVVIAHFAGRIIPIDGDVALRWGRLWVEMEKRGQTMGLADALIAATALTHDLTLITRDEHDFASCGVKLLNPWRTHA